MEEQKKQCFVITPIGDDNSEIRRCADGVINSVIKPVLGELGFEVIAPHEISAPGPIVNVIIDRILTCDLCIANLNGLNPNVMYELAVRHSANKPVVCIAEYNTKLPFDISNERVLFYRNDMSGVEELKKELRNSVEAAINTTQLNPITNACNGFELTKGSMTFENGMLEKLDILASKMKNIERYQRYQYSKNTYRKERDDKSTTFYICTDEEAFMYNLKERGYTKIVTGNSHLDWFPDEN